MIKKLDSKKVPIRLGIEDIAPNYNIVDTSKTSKLPTTIYLRVCLQFCLLRPNPTNKHIFLPSISSIFFTFPHFISYHITMSPLNTNNIVQNNDSPKFKVTIIGSGNWGSVASKLIASNTIKLPSFYGLCFVFYIKIWFFL